MTAETETTFADVAGDAVRWFETRSRDDSDETYVTLRDGHPEWVRDLVYDAHGDFLPEDWRYSKIQDALDFIRETDADDDADGGEFADQAVDVYTGDRLRWLASNLNRPGYCDEAAAEFGGEDTASDIVAMIGWGQYVEALEIFSFVVSSLRARVEEMV